MQIQGKWDVVYHWNPLARFISRCTSSPQFRMEQGGRTLGYPYKEPSSLPFLWPVRLLPFTHLYPSFFSSSLQAPFPRTSHCKDFSTITRQTFLRDTTQFNPFSIIQPRPTRRIAVQQHSLHSMAFSGLLMFNSGILSLSYQNSCLNNSHTFFTSSIWLFLHQGRCLWWRFMIQIF